ncbi:hypothetical protein EDC04DRAFT_2610799 [Pisolithus marmoratus]|nr:hypothetical protein EDC04DRAFT_2610799 [Pisolithus marmoratus]
MLSPALEDDNFLQLFSILLTVYSKVKKTSVKGKMTSKEEKSTKMKELLFALNSLNYIEFLQAILLRHGLAGYKVTEKKHFPLKYIPSKTKGEMVKKLTEDKPPMVILFMDMQYIEKLPRGSRSKGSPGSSEDDSEASSNSNKLQKAYKNEHDEGLTYPW